MAIWDVDVVSGSSTARGVVSPYNADITTLAAEGSAAPSTMYSVAYSLSTQRGLYRIDRGAGRTVGEFNGVQNVKVETILGGEEDYLLNLVTGIGILIMTRGLGEVISALEKGRRLVSKGVNSLTLEDMIAVAHGGMVAVAS